MQGMICAAMIAETASAALSICENVATIVFFAAGLGISLQQHFGDDAERAFGADENIFERITGDIFHALVAGPHHFAVGQNDFQAHDVIARDAVFQSAQAAGIFRDIAADGGNFHRARIGRIKQTRRVRGVGDLQAWSRPVRPAS